MKGRVLDFLWWAQYLVSFAVSSALELGVWLPCRVVSLFPGGGSFVRRVPFGDAFDRVQPPVTHYPTAEELDGWFKDAGFRNVMVRSKEGAGWSAAGAKA